MKASQCTNKQLISECIVGLSTSSSAKGDVPGDFAKTTPIAFFDSYPTLNRQPLHIPVDFQASLRHTPCFRRQPIDTLTFSRHHVFQSQRRKSSSQSYQVQAVSVTTSRFLTRVAFTDQDASKEKCQEGYSILLDGVRCFRNRSYYLRQYSLWEAGATTKRL